MEINVIKERVQKVFVEVFDNQNIKINDTTTAADVEGWDSLTHITLIGAIESEFGIRIPMKYVIGLKNVGELLQLIQTLIK